MKSKIIVVIALLLALFTTIAIVWAQPGTEGTPDKAASSAAPIVTGKVVEPKGANGPAIYIVQLQDAPVATYTGGKDGLPATAPSVTGARYLTSNAATAAYLDYLSGVQAAQIAEAEAAIGRPLQVSYTYQYAFNGYAARMTPAEAQTVAALSGVRQVFRETIEHLLTDAGPDWIGAPGIWDGTATGSLPGTMGEGVVVAILDTGINSQHPSFATVGGDGYVTINPLGSGNYIPGSHCDTAPSFCNDKLIGAWDMVNDPGDPGAPEDSDGHGSHTASTTAGNVVTATVYGNTPISLTHRISGVAPHANIIAYDVCVVGCPGAALLAAVNQVVADNAYITANSDSRIVALNYSISGGSDPYNDPVELAFLNATAAGVFVSASAGNSGPTPGTVAHLSPWVMTTAASTHNRLLSSNVVNMSGGDTTPPPDLPGQSFTTGYGPATIVYAGDFGDPLCPIGAFPPGTFNGEIVVCDRGVYARVDKGQSVLNGGGGGMILADNGAGIVADAHVLPASHISLADGNTLKTWLASGSGHMGSITGTVLDYDDSYGDIMAGFSSRGPAVGLEVLKPDITAPGVNIWAAVGDDGSGPPDYGFLSGTSMSSPHDAGAGALLAALHPDWTPYQIKSALMTTSYDGSTLVKETGAPSDPFDRGSGRVDLNVAGMAGLVLDETPTNFEDADPDLGGDPKTLNIASLYDSQCAAECSWTRTVSSTLSVPMTWTASVDASFPIDVTPSSFVLDPGATQTITITANVVGEPFGDWLFGTVLLSPDVVSQVSGGDTDVFTSTPAAAIPDGTYDGSAGTMACDTIDTSSIPGGNTVTDVYLDLAASHTWIGDLTIKLQSPDGSILGLLSRPGYAEAADDGSGCCGDSSDLAIAAPLSYGDAYSDDAETMGNTIGTSGVVCTDDGRCQYFANPDTVVGLADFAGFAGENASGDWQLCIGDSVTPDAGTFQSWTLTISHEAGGGGSDVPVAHFPVAVVPEGAVVDESVTIETDQTEGDYVVEDQVSSVDITDLVTETFGLVPSTVVTDMLSQDPTNGDPYDNLNDGTTFFVTVTVPSGALRLVAEITESEAPDIDLFVGTGDTPSAATEECFSAGGSNIEYCNINDPAAGVWWILVQNWDESADPPDFVKLQYGVVEPVSEGNMSVTGPSSVPAGTPFDVTIHWNEPMLSADMDRWYGAYTLGTSPGNEGDVGRTNVDLIFMPTPGIATDDSVSSTQAADTVFTQTLTIQSVGTGTLNWSIYEDASGLASPHTRLTPVAGLATGNAVSEAIAPVRTAGGPTVLYDQTDSPGTNGFPSQYFPDFGGGAYGADDFIVTDPTGWNIEQIFVAGSYTAGDGPAPDFDVTIYLDSGNLPGAQVYQETGIVATSDANGDITLDLSTPAALPAGHYWLSVNANMAFNPDTEQWFWSTRSVQSNNPYAWEDRDGLFGIVACATWQPGASVCGVGGGVDPDSLFSLSGTVGAIDVACDVPEDIAWLEVSPTSGSTPAGESSDVNVVFDSTALAGGVYTGTLCVTSDDPINAVVSVPVTLTVVSTPTYAVNLSTTNDAITDTPGTTVTYLVTVENGGDVADTYDLAAAGVWAATLSQDSVTLQPGETADVTVQVTIPGDAEDEDADVTTVTATSTGDGSITDSVSLTTTAEVEEVEYLIYLPIVFKE
jgi:subtilisin-like proprotein convertase family protein/subtilisin family serine protease